MLLYGLRGFTHGWAHTLTVLSPEGASAVDRGIGTPGGVRVDARPGRLCCYHEQRRGALDRLIAEFAIEVVDKHRWDAIKAHHGARVLG